MLKKLLKTLNAQLCFFGTESLTNLIPILFSIQMGYGLHTLLSSQHSALQHVHLCSYNKEAIVSFTCSEVKGLPVTKALLGY